MTVAVRELAKFLARKPFIFVIGVEKAGTTSINEFFRLTGQISTPFPKEISFFEENFSRGIEWYCSHFDFEKEVFAECTPTYHYSIESLKRIQSTSKHNTIAIMLRNPVERAYSAFVHRIYWRVSAAIKKNHITGFNQSFQEAVNKDIRIVTPSYRASMERAISVFGDRIVAIPLEIFVKRPSDFVNSISDSLGVGIPVSENARVPRSNALMLPQFFLGSELLEKHERAREIVEEPDAVYLCRGGMPAKVAEKESYNVLKAMERKWFEPIDEVQFQQLIVDYGEKEAKYLESKYGYDLDSWRKAKIPLGRVAEPFTSDPAAMSPEMMAWLEMRKFRGGDPVGAMASLRAAIEQSPGNVTYRRVLCSMLLTMREHEEAESVAREILSLAPADPKFYSLWLRASNRKRAWEYCRQAASGSTDFFAAEDALAEPTFAEQADFRELTLLNSL